MPFISNSSPSSSSKRVTKSLLDLLISSSKSTRLTLYFFVSAETLLINALTMELGILAYMVQHCFIVTAVARNQRRRGVGVQPRCVNCRHLSVLVYNFVWNGKVHAVQGILNILFAVRAFAPKKCAMHV